MARTVEGRRLTEAHKRQQIRLGGMAAALTAENAKRLDPKDLDGTAARWMAAQIVIVDTLRSQSQRLAEDYLRAFWKAEGMKPQPIVKPDLPPAVHSVAWVIPTIKARMARDAEANRVQAV